MPMLVLVTAVQLNWHVKLTFKEFGLHLKGNKLLICIKQKSDVIYNSFKD